MGRPASHELIGRETEVSSLVAALSAAEQGDCRVMFVSGEAGVGKTRLLREAERQARERGMLTMHGECLELHGGELPYAPLVAALQGAHGELIDEALDALPGAARLEIGRLVPELLRDGAHEQLDADPSQYAKGRLYEWLLRLIRRLSVDGAVLLAIEDLHWSDDATRDFITYLTRNAPGVRLALLATYRSDELRRDGGDPDPMRRLVGELRRSENVRVVTVDRLGRDDVMRQLDAILGRPADQRLLEHVYERSQGNPFFVEELLDAGAGKAGARLPESLLDALLVRVEALPAESLRVVRALGVIGRPAHQELLASVLGLPEDELSAPLRTAVGRHVLRCRAEDDAFEFHHALVREAVSADLMPGERKALHAAVAQALKDAGPASPAELASHWEAAGRPEIALPAHVAAGEEAERVYAFAEARRHFESALRLRREGSEVDEVELLRRAADAARFTGDSDAAVALGRRALAKVDVADEPRRAALLHERMGEYIFWGEDARMAAYEEALRLLPAGCEADRARILGAKALALHYSFRWREACACAEEALAVARSAGAAAEEADARMTLGTGLAFLGDPEAGEEQVREARRIGEPSARPEQRLRLIAHVAEVLRLRGRTAEALELMDEGTRLAGELGMSGSLGQVLAMNAAEDLIQLGRWDEADGRLGVAERLPLRDAAELLHRALLAQLAAARGAFDVAHERLAQADALCNEETASDYLASVYAARVEVALWEGRLEDARDETARGLDRVGAVEDPLYTPVLYSLGVRVEAELAAHARGRCSEPDLQTARETAQGLIARLDRLIERHAEKAAPVEAVAHRTQCEAELARLEERPAVQAWAAAVERWDAVGRPYPAAYARWRHAEALLTEGGGGADAADALIAARTIARRLDAQPLLDEVEALGRRSRLLTADETGGEPVASAEEAPFGLTKRELQVLTLIAEGCTNREIAERLFISERTAGVHVSHILAKLNTGNRVAAAGVAHQLRLLDSPRARG